jgi:hypothetical protein
MFLGYTAAAFILGWISRYPIAAHIIEYLAIKKLET